MLSFTIELFDLKALRGDEENKKKEVQMKNVMKLDDGTFKEATAKGVALVDFFAAWCGPCKMFAPVLEQLAEELEGKALVVKLDIEEAVETAAEFEVQSVPSLFVLKDGKIVKSFTGVQSKKTLLDAVENI